MVQRSEKKLIRKIAVIMTQEWSHLCSRGPKSLNFPDGNFQRAKTFRTKCVNRFRDKKSVRKFFLWQKRCINSFCDKKSVYRLFLQQNKCAQIIFATFQAIRKLSRYPKLSRLSGNFLDHPENMQPIRKRFRLSRNFSDHQENIQPIRKISSLSGKHPAYPENIQPIRKLSSLSGNFSGYPETFQAIQKLSRSSGKYPAYPENFQTIRKKSRLSGNFPKGPETSQCNFKGYAQKLSGRAKTFRMAMPPCHPGFWDSGGTCCLRKWIIQLDICNLRLYLPFFWKIAKPAGRFAKWTVMHQSLWSLGFRFDFPQIIHSTVYVLELWFWKKR